MAEPIREVWRQHKDSSGTKLDSDCGLFESHMDVFNTTSLTEGDSGLIPGAGIAANSSTDNVYVAVWFGNNVVVNPSSSRIAQVTIPVGTNPLGVAVGTTNKIYVANSGSRHQCD